MTTTNHLSLDTYIALSADGSFDKDETLRRFEADINEYTNTTEQLKPLIIASIKSWSRLSEQTIINFTLRSLKLPINQDNVSLIHRAIDELVIAEIITPTLNKHGGTRGRRSGYVLRG